ncbi:uncharacterized protein BP5553_09700 [Venustampulla echinocandica]|uniref:SAP domain-containing protein n=1 Tax=Venustampulla echinocandica TaxID=2656787 RepID=A0A370TBR0_9HELO|nr:uncharacterized protein BP5553_09700 [Venustampulla echinocandica]RDL31491.1 hypothetical protein BP5553_09700 [Venustampulla echinocandica]
MTDWNKLKVVDLKAELKKRGLPQTGLKPALVARLTAAETEDGSESEATVQGDVAKQDANSATSPDTISPIQPSSDQKIDIPSDAPRRSPSEPKTEPAAAKAPSPIPQDLPAGEAQTEDLPAPSPSVTESSAQTNGLPLARPEEPLEDGNKRKRRSQSPPPTDTDLPRKRVRQVEAQESTGISTSSRGAVEAEAQNAANDRESEAGAGEVASSTDVAERAPEVNDVAMEDAPIESSPRRESRAGQVSGDHMVVDEKPKDAYVILHEESPSRPRNSKYKDLFSTQNPSPPLEKPTPRDSAPDAVETEPDHVISPAIHPATAALYIRDFMRPLNPGQLKNHLATLAAPPGRDPDPDVIVNFYLDPIRTHAFIHFTSVSAASRVRSVIHDRIWPDERTRKPLWADFIPVDKVEEWIQTENEIPGGRAMAKKWEVYYDVGEDRNVTTVLQEAGAAPHGEPTRKASNALQPPPTPTQPRGVEGAPSGPRAAQIRGQRTATNLSRLDQLFNCTTAKPALYWKPVDKALADKRLDNIDHATSKEYVSNRTGGDINRYTFEDGEVVVDRGPEIFPGIRPPMRDGPRGGGPRGGRGYQGRGGYGRGSERYDSYRNDMRDSRDNRRY